MQTLVTTVSEGTKASHAARSLITSDAPDNKGSVIGDIPANGGAGFPDSEQP